MSQSSPTKTNRKRGVNNRGLTAEAFRYRKKGVYEIEAKYTALAAQIGHDAFNAEAELIKRWFDDFDDESLKITRKKKIIKSMMMDNFGKKKTNHRVTKKFEETIQPI